MPTSPLPTGPRAGDEEPTQADPDAGAADATDLRARLRAMGWTVAAHNDYADDAGAARTFWSFVNAKTFQYVKGWGATDAEALRVCFRHAQALGFLTADSGARFESNTGKPLGRAFVSPITLEERHALADMAYQWAVDADDETSLALVERMLQRLGLSLTAEKNCRVSPCAPDRYRPVDPLEVTPPADDLIENRPRAIRAVDGLFTSATKPPAASVVDTVIRELGLMTQARREHIARCALIDGVAAGVTGIALGRLFDDYAQAIIAKEKAKADKL